MRLCFVFFFNDTATTEIYTLSLHDALPISVTHIHLHFAAARIFDWYSGYVVSAPPRAAVSGMPYFFGNCRPRRCGRSEEHTSELQSRSDIVCRLLLEKKNKRQERYTQSLRS